MARVANGCRMALVFTVTDVVTDLQTLLRLLQVAAWLCLAIYSGQYVIKHFLNYSFNGEMLKYFWVSQFVGDE